MNEMMKWIKKFSQNQKGFSLVELLCAVAILSIVVVSVGTSMVVSARSYQRSNTELDLQQKSQITANLLTNLIIDADTITSPPADGTSSNELKIVKDGVEYQISLSGNSLIYTTSTDSGTLAEDIKEFSIRRVKGNNVDFTLEVERGDRSFKSDYHVTPRNGENSGDGGTTGTTKSILAENELTLEPNQVYEDLNVQIIGAPTDSYEIVGLSGNTDINTKVEPIDANTIKITVGSNEYGDVGDGGKFRFQIKALKSDGSDDAEVSLFPVSVYVRRVTGISVSGSKTEGSRAKANSVYQVTAQTTGTNLPRVPGAWYDLDYVPTYPVTWELRGEGLPGPVENYAVRLSSSGDATVPFYNVKLLQDIPQGGAVKIVAVAKHPEGTVGAEKTNKSGLPYGTVVGEYVIKAATDINRGESADRTPFSFGVGDLGVLPDYVRDTLYWNKLNNGWESTTDTKYNEIKTWYDSSPADPWNELKNKFGNTHSYVEYRYILDEEKADESKWSPWIPVLEYQGGTPIFRPAETVYFKPDKDYILQTRVTLTDTYDTSIIYWPLEDTPQQDYMKEYFVSKVEILLQCDALGIPKDSEGNNTVRNIQKGVMFNVMVSDVVGYSVNDFQKCLRTIVQKKDGLGNWVEADLSEFDAVGGNRSPGTAGTATIFNNARWNTTGEYRILFYMKDVPYCESVGAPQTTVDCPLYDETTGRGIIYLNVTE